MRSVSAALVLSACILLGAAACGSGSKDSAPANDSSPTTASTASTTTTVPTTNANVSSTHCPTDQLRGGLGESQSGAGQRYTTLVLTNTGTRACDLREFPGISLLDQNGKQIGQPASREGAEGPTVVLQPGGSASTVLHTSAPGLGPSCDPASAQIRVYPPDNTAALTVTANYTACGGFRVSTLVAGTTGN